MEAEGGLGMPSPLSFNACLVQDVANLGGAGEAEGGLGLRSPLSFGACLGHAVSNLGGVVETDIGLGRPSPLSFGACLSQDVTNLDGIVEAGSGLLPPLILGPDVIPCLSAVDMNPNVVYYNPSSPQFGRKDRSHEGKVKEILQNFTKAICSVLTCHFFIFILFPPQIWDIFLPHVAPQSPGS